MGQKARERVAEMQRQEAARRRRRTVAVTVVVVLAVLVGVGVAVQSARNSTGGGATPTGVVDDFGVVRGDADAPVTVTLYEDFQCPACRALEEQAGEVFADLAKDGSARVVYRPMAFLDQASTTNYSSRALEAAACVLEDAGPDAFVRMHDLLFEHQPPEGGAGLPDQTLADLAEQAGANRDAITSCQQDDTFAAWVERATEQASKDGVNGTPTVLVDGKQVEFGAGDPGETIRRAVAEATP